jgi:predicted short-subunit dehydrogenase-like oxidoreductase (DUF2520 family)
MARALRSVGHDVEGPLTRGAELSSAAQGSEVLIIATSDAQIREVAAAVSPQAGCVVIHLAGSVGLEVLGEHPRRAALHPLVPLPTAELGAARLCSGITFAVAGDPMAAALAGSLGGKVVSVADEDRARYHAAACVAANHVVALLAQVERLADSAGLELAAFVDLARFAVEDVAALGPRSALTGPAARGDWATLERHLEAIPEAERASYRAGVWLCLEVLAAGALVEPLDEPANERLELRSPSFASPA